MKDKKTAGSSIVPILLLAVILLLSGHSVSGHKDKPHTDVDSSPIDTSNIATDSVTKALDSVYSIIQEDYQKLQFLFQRACYDCHSSQTNYPWYYKLPFIKGLIDDDINEARKHLDLSDGFPFAGHGLPAEDLDAIKKVLEEGDMPPFKYKMLHWGAGFSPEEIDSVTTWVGQSLDLIKAHSPSPAMPGHDDPVQKKNTHEE